MSRFEFHLYPTDLKFSVFSSSDAKELSVVKIVTGLTFNALEHALPGGLYDPAMGRYSKSADPCATCLSTMACPGHFGHIELNSLVYNPFFTKLVHDILRFTCLSCFRLQLTDHVRTIVELQLNLVDAGFVVEAQDIEVFRSEFVAKSAETVVKTEAGAYLHPKIAEMYDLLEREGTGHDLNTRTSSGIRSSIVRSLLQNTVSKKCVHCSENLKRVKYSYGKLIMNFSKADMQMFYDQGQIENRASKSSNTPLLPDECRQILRKVYENYATFFNLLFPVLNSCSKNVQSPVDIFFMNVVPVTPSQARPVNIARGQISEHPQTVVYRNIIEANTILSVVMKTLKNDMEDLPSDSGAIVKSISGETSHEKLYNAWQDLQTKVDQLLDINLGREKSYMQGLKQILEKKDGLMRKHMMGKRVNYAARTVITPDPNINVDELGIPDIFAKKLSYPVPVTPWNVSELRKLVINGPDEHPGANYVEDQKGFKMLIPPGDPAKRQSMAKLLLTNPVDGIKVVHRHLRNGDILLLNRQPTLHRPSIMAHKARILQGEKTFRLHYSNCKAYNADFDGDEMNAHFPQNEVCRSEAYNLVNVSNQYLVPKDGTPLGGLIQDHVVSGVKLSIRGRFFNREDYQQLVYQGLSHRKRNIKLLPPAIVKPFKLWSGKQILSTIILNIIPNGSVPLNLTSTAKISPKAWQTDLPRTWTFGGSSLEGIHMTESEVIIRGGELLVGVLDKTHYGATPFGLVHCMYELYGGNCSTQLLTSFAKLLTNFLQRDGFTLGVQDILVTSRADKQRRSIIKNSRTIGNDIVADVLGMVPDSTLAEKVEENYAFNPKFRTMLDRKYKSVLDGFTNEINRVCHPAGLLHKFPFNNLQLMILSGAKGSTVNAMQISCLLGQIELEGKRPPLMISGKSLPSFATFETSPKSGGFIDGRFMTGIQPQDFFFHCMAGREGLIDTAVKTSRSGYLQRCLIKHLEGLNVNYDLTVRDSDNCVIQFMYGEDGMDISKCRFLNSKGLKFLDENSNVILNNSQLDMNNDFDTKSIRKHGKKLKSWIKKNGESKAKRRVSAFLQFSSELREEIEVENSKKRNKKTGRLKIDEKLIKLWCKADAEKKESYTKKFKRCPDPLISKFNPDNVFGSISEYLEDLMKSYFMEHPERQDEFTKVMHVKSMQSVVNPGEPVGLLAAQSVGEPSTQMTLNTFHFAGRGEMNVTLGIPRLREILMLASANIKTPSMDIPFKSNHLDKAEKLRIKLNRVTVADVLQYINVKISMTLRPERAYQYQLYFKFLPRKAYKDDFGVKPNEIIKYMSTKFFNSMFKAILRSSKNKLAVIELDSDTNKKSQEDDDNGEIDIDPSSAQPVQVDTSEDEQEGEDDDATDIRLKKKQKDENDYDDPDVEEEIDDTRDDEDVEPDMLEDHETSGELDEDETINAVLNYEHVNSFTYDKEHYMWCNMAFNLPMKYKNLDISNLLRQVAKNSVIWEVNKIKRAITYTQQDQLILKTEGINIVEMFKYNKLLELNRLYSNDIHAIAKTYGIEAASRVVVKEVQNVFKVYGITVDPRHLMLIADYMTFEGTFKPLSRKGMEFCTSPLQQMSFESSLQFLKSATINGVEDSLSSPSSRLMVGLPVKSGTGLFSLLAKIAV